MDGSTQQHMQRPECGAHKAAAVVAALDGLDERQLHRVIEHIEWRLRVAGPPRPPFTTLRAEADAWAAIASLTELKFYIAAAIVRLPQADRAGLTAYIGKLGS